MNVGITDIDFHELVQGNERLRDIAPEVAASNDGMIDFLRLLRCPKGEVSKSLKEQRIRELAYDKWEKNGHPHGRDREFWLQAEAEYHEAEVLLNNVKTAR
jgi:hypothetical protein